MTYMFFGNTLKAVEITDCIQNRIPLILAKGKTIFFSKFKDVILEFISKKKSN